MSTALANPFRGHLLALVDVLEDHCRDLDVVHADAALEDIHIALGRRDDAVTLAARLGASPRPVETVAPGTTWSARTPAGVRVQISDWSHS